MSHYRVMSFAIFPFLLFIEPEECVCFKQKGYMKQGKTAEFIFGWSNCIFFITFSWFHLKELYWRLSRPKGKYTVILVFQHLLRPAPDLFQIGLAWY